MKKTILMFLTVAVSIALVRAQNYPTPEVKDAAYYYDQGKNILIKLEHSDLNIERRHSGIWGSVEVIAIAGESSNVRFSKNEKTQFLIQLSDPDANPSAICELDAFEKKGQREYIATKKGAHGSEKQESVLIKFTKIKDGLYLITPSKTLGKGEYFFKILSTKDLYAFGLD